MKRKLLLLLSSIVIILASCKKDDTKADTTGIQGIQGTYNLKYITVKSNGTLTALNRKTVNVADYTTTNNGGTLVIDASKLTANGLTYKVNSTPTSYIYTDNTLLDSMQSTFTLSYPASNFTASYKLVGTDSIYFPQGSPASAIFSSSSMQSGSYGGKYNLSNNVLTIIQSALKDSSFQASGLTYYMTSKEVATIVLEKQ